MHTTPPSLLERLKQPNSQEAWARFVKVYTPLIYYWARRAGLQEQDSADLVQDVFAALVEKLPEFRYDHGRSFRNWLRTVTLNKWRENWRRRQAAPIAGPNGLSDVAVPDNVEAFTDADYRQHVVEQALEVMKSEFQTTTWKACWEHVVSGKSAAEVAAELNLTEGAVRAAKFRVLCRLRQELAGLLD